MVIIIITFESGFIQVSFNTYFKVLKDAVHYNKTII